MITLAGLLLAALMAAAIAAARRDGQLLPAFEDELSRERAGGGGSLGVKQVLHFHDMISAAAPFALLHSVELNLPQRAAMSHSGSRSQHRWVTGALSCFENGNAAASTTAGNRC